MDSKPWFNLNPNNYIGKRIFDLKKDFYKMGEISRNIFNFKEISTFQPSKIIRLFPQLFFFKNLFTSKLPLFYLNENIISRNNAIPTNNDGYMLSAHDVTMRLNSEVNEYLFCLETKIISIKIESRTNYYYCHYY